MLMEDPFKHPQKTLSFCEDALLWAKCNDCGALQWKRSKNRSKKMIKKHYPEFTIIISVGDNWRFVHYKQILQKEILDFGFQFASTFKNIPDNHLSYLLRILLLRKMIISYLVMSWGRSQHSTVKTHNKNSETLHLWLCNKQFWPSNLIAQQDI